MKLNKDKLILKEICDSHELKIRISGADDYVTPEQEWCKKFHDHCCLFYNNLYDQNAYLNNIEKFNIKEVNKKFIWIGVSIGIIVPFFITLIAEIKNQDLGLIMFFEFFVISPVGAFLGFLIAKLICKKMYG